MSTNWSALRTIGNLPIMKVTLIGPFLPFLFKAFDALAKSEGLRPYIGGLETGWPYTTFWSLYVFYFGSTFLGLASAAYLLFCPDVVKRHEDAVAFIDRESTTREATEVKSPEQIKVEMTTNYRQDDLSRPKTRQTVYSLFVVGFVLLFIPPIFRFGEVVLHLGTAILALARA